jgi:hypothetical protein
LTEGDINYMSANNVDCQVKINGVNQRAALVLSIPVPGGVQDVAIQDQSSELLSLFLGEIKDTLTVLANILKDAVSIDVETTGFLPTVGLFLCLQEDGKITQSEITAVTPIAGNQYTLGLSIPSDYPFTTASGCSLLDVEMNVNGLATPTVFQIQPKAGTKWDITRMMTSMVLSSAGDDGLLGNISAVANGIYFRKEDSLNSNNIFNAKENSDFAIEGYDTAYPIRSGGGGSHGFRSRITWGGQNKQGVVIRLDGDSGDSFTATVRDDLRGINKYRTKIQGHVVED